MRKAPRLDSVRLSITELVMQDLLPGVHLIGFDWRSSIRVEDPVENSDDHFRVLNAQTDKCYRAITKVVRLDDHRYRINHILIGGSTVYTLNYNPTKGTVTWCNPDAAVGRELDLLIKT